MTAGTPHQALYRRWRAQTFSEIVGQEAVVATLRNAVLAGKVAHAILFTGPRGTGKTSLARILAKALNCTDLQANGDPCDRCEACAAIREGRALDLVEIDAASNRGINDVRELRERLSYAPTDLRRKVYILDEAHQITKDAWNALLKSLEEPPDFVSFMFASTHPQDFPPAILSRLQRFDVRRLTPVEITGKLERILEADGRTAEPEAIDLVARLAAGGMRDAESILDQLLASTADRIEADAVRDLMGLADGDLVDGFVAAVAGGDAAAGIELLDGLEERGRDLRVFLDQVVDALREAILAGLREDGRADPGLTSAARRLAAIDPTRLGAGGLRLQLELVLLDPGAAATSTAARPAVRERSSSSASPDAIPEPREVAPVPTQGPAAPSPPERAGATSAATDEARPSATTAAPAIDHAVPGAGVAQGGRATKPESAGPEAAQTGPEPAQPEMAQKAAQKDRALARDAADAPVRQASSPAPEPMSGGEQLADGSAQASRPGEPAGAADDDLDRLRHGWSTVVTTITERNRAVKPLITACRPIGIEGSVVTLGFPEEQGFLRDVAERRRPLLEECIGAFLGHDVGVRCIATNLDLVPPLPSDQDAERILEEAHRIFADDRLDVPDVS